MSDYTIKIDEENERVLFSGVTWGYGVGCELPLWLYREHLGLVVVKVVGASYWGGLAQPAGYSPAEFMVLRILDVVGGDSEPGWVRAENVIRFPIRKERRAE